MVSKSLLFALSVSAVVFLSECSAVNNRIDQESSDYSRSYAENPKVNEVEEDSWWAFPGKQLNMLQRMFNDCSYGSPITVCLKAKAVTFLDRVLRKDSVQIMEGLSLVADRNSTMRARAGRALSEQELVASLPRELGQKEETLDKLIVAKLTEFFGGHQIKLDLTEATSEAGEGRGKSKKILPYLFLGKLVAATHMAVALKALALLAGKALIVAKIALVLASVVALKKLFHHGGGHHTSYEVVQAEADHHDRIYNADPSLPYRGYVGQ